jgi:NhaP-type Na+/H+ or K+/H+ antiporter
MLGLGLLGVHELGAWGTRWWIVDVAWATAGGIAIGFVVGALIGRLVLHLRVHHREALGADEFIAFGTIALAYGLALVTHTYGFLAVFSAGLALRGIADASTQDPRAIARAASSQSPADAQRVPASMMSAVQRFNEQLERFGEVAVVVAVGALLATISLPREALWLVPLLFLVVRPLGVYVGLAGADASPMQKRMMAWFGIRGIGSIYYLMYAIRHDIDADLAQRLLGLTLAVVVASVVAHGISVTPLMNRYERLRGRTRPARQERSR